MGAFYKWLFEHGTQNHNATFMDWKTKRRLFKRSHKGFLVDGKRLKLNSENSFRHQIIVGGAGSGKSSSMIQSNILATKKDKSLVITDTGELYPKSKTYLESIGYQVQTINLTNIQDSLCFNPLTLVQNASDAQYLAKNLVEITTNDKVSDPFWSSQSVSLISLIIRRLVFSGQTVLPINLHSILTITNKLAYNGDIENPDDPDSPIMLDKFFLTNASSEEQDQYAQLIKLSDNLFSSIIASVKSALTELENPIIKHLTSSTTLDFTQLRNKEQPLALFIIQREDQLQRFSFYTTLLYETIFNYLMQAESHSDELPVFFLLDEFVCQNFNKERFTMYCAVMRRRKISLCLVVQSLSQVQAKYGIQGAKTILSNMATKIVFGGLTDPETGKWLESLMGDTTITNEKGYEKTKPLMTTHEIRKLKGKVLLIFDNEDPIIFKTTPYFKNHRLNKRSQM